MNAFLEIPNTLDPRDWQLLYLLDQNSRESFAALAKPLRLSMNEEVWRKELAAVVDPSSYEFQLHSTILKRAMAEAKKGSEEFS